jgi:hypothetical protein
MSSDNQDGVIPSTRQDILTILDSFIQHVHHVRKILLGVSVTAIVLTILLGAVIVSSGTWLFTGIRQYYSMSQWKKRYEEYRREKEEIDRKIASQFGLDQD